MKRSLLLISIFLVLISSSVYGKECTTCDQGIIAHYALENNTNDYTTDYNGSIVGTVTNASLSSCYMDSCYSFPGGLDGGYVEMGDTLLDGFDDKSFTIAGWGYFNSGQGAAARHAMIGLEHPTNSGPSVVALGYMSDSYNWTSSIWDGSSNFHLYSTINMENVWNYAMLIVYGDNNTIQLFVNGTFQTAQPYDGSINANFGNYFNSIGDQRNTDPNQYSWDGYIDEVTIWNRSLTLDEATNIFTDYENGIRPYDPASLDAPYVVNGSINFTSDGGQDCGFNGSIYTVCGPSNDTSPTFTFETTTNANCKLETTETNYSASTEANCSGVGTISHTCVVSPPLGLDTNLYSFYISCENSASLGTENTDWINANSLNYTLDFTPGAGDVTGYCTQYLEVDSYTGLSIDYNLTVECFNPNNYAMTSVTIDPDDDFGAGTTTIGILANSSNSTVFTNTSVRGTSDGSLYELAGASITANITQTTNIIQTYVPIDPPSAFSKDGVVDCTQAYTLTTGGSTVGFDLNFTGSGETYIDSTIDVSGDIINIDSGCIVYLNASGLLNLEG